MSPVARYWDGAAWTDIATLLPGSLPYEPWHEVGAAGEPAFGTGWSNAAGGTTVAFRKTPDGKIQFKGLAAASAGASQPVFVLPASHRPAVTVNVGGTLYKSGGTGEGFGVLHGHFELTAAGAVNASAHNGAAIAFPYQWVSFEGVEFPTGQATWPSGPAGGASASRVTSLPASPYDGQEVVYVADSAAGVLWRLRFNAGSASAYKWEFIGGSPLENSVDTLQQTTSTTSADLPTALGLTLPLAGDYDLAHGFGFGDISPISYHNTILEVGGVDWAPSLMQLYPAGGVVLSGAMARRRLALSAGTVVKQQYYSGGAGSTSRWRDRWLKAEPVRVG